MGTYWKRFRRAPEMVVMFVSSEAAFAAAAQHDASLIEDAARNRVVIATPSTMLALLQVVALGWREAALSRHAERIRELGVELVRRLAVVRGQLVNQGKGLERAVQSYNSAVASFESRLLVTARRMGELGVQETDRLEEPPGIATAVTQPAASGALESNDRPMLPAGEGADAVFRDDVRQPAS